MSISPQVAFPLNALLVLLLVNGITRIGAPERHSIPRTALLALLVHFDACLMLWLNCSVLTIVYVAALVCFSSLAFPKGLTCELSRAFGRSRFAVYILSVSTFVALVYLYLPITTFLTSPGDIGVHLEYLLATNARSAMVVIYLAAALYGFAVSPQMKSLLALMAMTSLSLSLVYSYGYPFGYPMMNGLMFEQIPIATSTLILRGFVDALTVVVVVLLSLLALMRLGPRRVLLGVVLVNVSLALAAGYRVVRDTSDYAPGRAKAEPPATQRSIRFSKERNNVLILFLDRFMGGFVEGILKAEPQLVSGFDGFTWYPRTLSAGENSIAGIHPMLGGYDYTPREMNARNLPLRDLSVESYSLLPFNFTKKGYTASLVNPRGLGFTMDGDCSFLEMKDVTCTHIPAAVSKGLAEQYGVPMRVLAKANYADLLVLLGLMRGSPYVVRGVLHMKGPWQPLLDHSAGTTFKEWAELKSLPALSATDADRGHLDIVFSILPHEPYFMGEDCRPRPAPLQLSQEEVHQRGHANLFEYQHALTAKCTLLLVSDYFRWMKQAGVYDNTKIVVVSDHGIVGPVEDRSSRAVAGSTTASFFVKTRPVLFVKERNARGELNISEDFMPNAEVPRIVCEEIGGCVNPYLGNRTVEAHGRDRPFYVDFVPWQFNLQQPNRFKILDEVVVVDGDPYDARQWRAAVPRE